MRHVSLSELDQSYIFLYKNIIVSTWSGSKCEWSLLMSRPAAENWHSDCAEVAMQAVFLNMLGHYSPSLHRATCTLRPPLGLLVGDEKQSAVGRPVWRGDARACAGLLINSSANVYALQLATVDFCSHGGASHQCLQCRDVMGSNDVHWLQRLLFPRCWSLLPISC